MLCAISVLHNAVLVTVFQTFCISRSNDVRLSVFCLLWRHAKVRGQLIEKFVDQILSHGCMDDIKREELEKACKKENLIG